MDADPLNSIHPAAARIVADVPCPFCGCLCDDLQVTIEEGRVASVTGGCALARPWFLGERDTEPPNCRIDGRPADLNDALVRAAELLGAARYPLVYGLSRATCEAQAAAVEIAEILGGVIDTPTSRASLGALQTVGDVTCTLGEMRSRADLIVVWGVDPMTTHPRFLERYAPRRLARRFVVIDSRATATSESAEERIAIRAGADFEAARVLRALGKGLSLDEAQVAERTGVPLAVWQALFDRMKRARYGVLLCGGADDSQAARRLHETLAALVRQLNHHARFVSLALRTEGNLVGADNVLAWRTGYSTAVDFSRGYPRSNPDEFTAERLLERGEIDAALVICDDPLARLSSRAREHFKGIPTVVLDWNETATAAAAQIAIPVATIGVESGGSVFRCDGVPLALRPVIAARYPADHEVLRALKVAIQSHRR